MPTTVTAPSDTEFLFKTRPVRRLFDVRPPGSCHLLVDKMSDVYGGYQLKVFANMLSDLVDEAALRAKERRDARRFQARKRVGATLRPGKGTPLWNRLRADLRSQLRKRGEQVKLARVIGLPRQQVNAFLTRGNRMPDAERTLLMLAWIAALKAGRPMS